MRMGRQNVEKMRGRDTRMEIAREFTYSISTVIWYRCDALVEAAVVAVR
jgi:hypothetical protein